MLPVLEIFISVIFIVVMVTQVIIPIIIDKPIFYMLRKSVRQAEKQIAENQIEKQIVEQQIAGIVEEKEVVQKRRRLKKLKQEMSEE